MEEENLENISSQYLNNEQIKVYLEACLDHRITDFQELGDSQKINEDYYDKEEFERLKQKKVFKDQDNLFYRVWVYQYEGLKELLKQPEEKILNRGGASRIRDYNFDDGSKQKGVEKDKKTLSFRFTFGKIEIVSKLTDTDVYKYLFKLEDNQMVEAVIMHHDDGYSICLSTQVGCNMGCTFCESGRRKKVRNLECYEMVLPILLTEEDLKIKISRVVLMGIGEPFDNYDNVINFINIINNPFGLAIG